MPRRKGTPPKTPPTPKPPAPDPGPKFCLRCDGTGLLCNICGESETACGCTPDDVLEYELANPEMAQYDECSECQ